MHPLGGSSECTPPLESSSAYISCLGLGSRVPCQLLSLVHPSFQVLSSLQLSSAHPVHLPSAVPASSQQLPPALGSSPQQSTRPSTPSWTNHPYGAAQMNPSSAPSFVGAHPLLVIQPHTHATAERGAMPAAATSAVATSAAGGAGTAQPVVAFIATAPSPPTLLSSNFHLSPAATPPRLPAHVAEVSGRVGESALLTIRSHALAVMIDVADFLVLQCFTHWRWIAVHHILPSGSEVPQTVTA